MKLIFRHGPAFQMYANSLLRNTLQLQLARSFGGNNIDYEIQFEQADLPQGDLLYVLVFEGVELSKSATQHFGDNLKTFLATSSNRYLWFEGSARGKHVAWKFYPAWADGLMPVPL